LRDRHPLAEAYVEAAQQCGYPRNDDFQRTSAGRCRLLPDHHAQRRKNSSTAASYLKPASARQPQVVSEALATRILR
jgi:choline dehydrogenase